MENDNLDFVIDSELYVKNGPEVGYVDRSIDIFKSIDGIDFYFMNSSLGDKYKELKKDRKILMKYLIIVVLIVFGNYLRMMV